MVNEAITRIYKSGQRHSIYLRKDLVEDTMFPFEVGEPLLVKIEGNKLIVEKGKEI